MKVGHPNAAGQQKPAVPPLFTQYTLFADTNFDDGLREANGDARKAFAVWCALQEFDPHDPLPREWRPG